MMVLSVVHASSKTASDTSSGPSYGVDVSLPVQHASASTNYAWLPHNVAPESNPTPSEYKDMPIQPLGDRQAFYEDMIQGCLDKYGEKGTRCLENEADRIEMNLRQPQSMVNYTKLVCV